MNLRIRKPDKVIIQNDKPYMRRWHLTERVPEKSKIYLHNILLDDEDRAMHDHPSDSISIILWGGYIEYLFAYPPRAGSHLPPIIKKRRAVGMIVKRSANTAHRLELYRRSDGSIKSAWTIFIFGPKLKDWGFWCKKRVEIDENDKRKVIAGGKLVADWKHWRDYHGVPSGEEVGDEVGPGCGE